MSVELGPAHPVCDRWTGVFGSRSVALRSQQLLHMLLSMSTMASCYLLPFTFSRNGWEKVVGVSDLPRMRCGAAGRGCGESDPANDARAAQHGVTDCIAGTVT